ncbi:MAG: proline dehydrogenase family protein [Dehalococcoidia bacterium]
MAAEISPERQIEELQERLARAAEGSPSLALSPSWWQEHLLSWATNDPDFRVKLLRFVDVLPTLRSTRAVADHVRQYFRDAEGLVHTASGLAAQPVFRPVLSRVVRQGVFAMAHRFIAGDNPLAALSALRDLARDGIAYTVDLLGEETLSDEEADAYLRRYVELIDTLAASASEINPHGEHWAGVPPVNVSIKLSALCPRLEPAAPECVSASARERLRPLLRTAMEHGAFINFDMEQFRYKDLVHRTFADVVTEPEFAAYPHLGIVVQAYLRDALDDVGALEALAGRRGAPFTVRLVKGAYWDEENIVASQNAWPVPVWEEKPDTDANFERCAEALLSAWPSLRPAFGSHNPRSVAHAVVTARRAGLDPKAVEFQTLYGMAEGLRTAVAEEGYRTRVYVPVGKVIPGMAYLVRRLLENTSNQAWFNVGVTGTPDGGASLQRHRTAGTAPPAERDQTFRNAAPARYWIASVRERTENAIRDLRSQFGQEYPLLVGGRRVTDRRLADVVYPAEPGTVIGRVAQGSRDDVEAAVASAREAYPAWRDRTAHERAEILARAADIVESRRFELIATMVFESAKPWHEADGDVIEAIDYLRYYPLQAESLAAPRLMMADVPGERNEYFYEGRGVTAVIAPWNFPLAIICGMTAGSLAGGNAAILKPAMRSPVVAHKLVEILHAAGVPPGVVQYLPGTGREVGQAMVEHQGIDNIAFTGSNAVGLGIIEAAARSRGESVKRVVAELGGKNAVIIDDDADLDQAVSGVVASAFGYAGQKCSACSRLIIVGSAFDEALARLKNAVESLVVGPPHDPATVVPPVIDAEARDRIMQYIEDGKSTATLSAQGHAPRSGGFYVPPSVFTDVALDSPLAREEIFGPVLTVFRALDFEEALEVAMDSQFGLTGGVFSRNPRHIEMARQRFRVGNLYINRNVTGAVVGRQPFGGLRGSGVGEKAGGPDYVRQFMAPRSVSENTTRRGFAPETGA